MNTTRNDGCAGVPGDKADLLYGVPAIADFLSLRERQARGRIEAGDLPTFKIGGTICARRSTLNAWLAEREAAARSSSLASPRGSSDE